MRPSTHRRRRGLVACIAIACLALALASSASAEIFKGPLNKEDFLRFINCPITSGKVCTYGETLSGEFKIGSHSVPITNPTILQGGIEAEGLGVYPLIPPRFGVPAVSKSPQKVPGGLTGLSEEVGGPVYATAEQAGPILIRPVALGFGEHTAIQFPIRVHLENELLGPNCYIGSEAEPVVLHLTDGTTEPPEGTEPIKGSIGKVEGPDKGKITLFKGNKLVDNGCVRPGGHGLRHERSDRSRHHAARQHRRGPALRGRQERRDPRRQPLHRLLLRRRQIRQKSPERKRKPEKKQKIGRRAQLD